MDLGGNVIWANNSIGSGTPLAITVDRANHIYICGKIYDTSNFTLGSFVFHNTYLYLGGFLACYNPFGAVIWSKDYCPITVPSAESDNAAVCGLAIDPCNNVWMLGQIPTNGSIFIDSSTVLAGASGTAWPTMIVGYNSSGALLQSISFYIEADDNSGISCDNSGNIYYCGDDGRTRNFGGHTIYWTGASEQIMAAKYDPSLGCAMFINPISGDSVLCKGDTTTLRDTTSGGIWSSSNASIVMVGSSPGHITGVSFGVATITYSLGTNHYTKMVYVISAPSPIIGNRNICEGSVAGLIDGTTGGLWSSNNISIATVGSLTGIVYGIASGLATITYAISPGCFVTISDTVFDCVNEVSLAYKDKDHITVYPNPATSELNITSTTQISSITITNLLGQIVYTQQQLYSQQAQINVSTLPAGIYFVKINGTEVRKFVKE